MTDLLWPGDERAGDLLGDAHVLAATVQIEQAWLDALVDAGLAPKALDLVGLVGPDDLPELAAGAEDGGTPVIGLVALLRRRAAPPGAAESDATWIHQGLTSQDVVDTAVVLVLRDALDHIAAQLREQAIALVGHVEAHRRTVMVGRTLTQHAVPTTFGLVAAGWLEGLLDAAHDIDRVRGGLPAQLGGAVGTLAATTELARLRGRPDPAAVAVSLARSAATTLGLAWTTPWHVRRTPVVRAGDALVTATDAWGHVATDVLTLARPEIAELAEPTKDGRGGSSTMPHKQNPVLSVLLRRAALAAPPLASTLHTAAALAGDQRPDGSWHAEWETLRTLARRAVVASEQASELLAGLRVDAARMRATLEAAGEGIFTERDGVRRSTGAGAGSGPDVIGTEPVGTRASSYLGATELFVDATLVRTRTFLEASA
ncbi:3-carboxy-cis,cis-muconate cycloisomerase [Mumia sp. zg.B53]|uniref:lyase family protein n=1 Tax=unclassified Mumia TaxID=2621872 RepID=UPI001C6DDB50|nr:MULTISPECIES: lyase family protein [unclassified Mumia]MBW9207608.1 3-carboxy-cis,cis-muconate cycloisomerase [Mumia sp. zg.B17]MBW9214650.1 3-carboxy-cis,cis-muconate cycloisomerase [Mumia sp. zg.B53]